MARCSARCSGDGLRLTTGRSLAAAAALAAATTSSAGDLPVARADGLPLTRCWGEMRLDSCSNACAMITRERERRVPPGGAGRVGGPSGAGWLGVGQGGGGEGHGFLSQGERSPLNAEAEAGAGARSKDWAVAGVGG